MLNTRCPNCGEESTQEMCDRCDVEIKNYCPCGQEKYKDCQGVARCEECDEPCPHCDDGGLSIFDDDDAEQDSIDGMEWQEQFAE